MDQRARSEPAPEPSPVLCLAFNRPDLLEEVLAAVRAAGRRELFISIDGPRPGHPGDVALRDRVLEIAQGIDWASSVNLKVEEENLGVIRAVETALAWAFERAPELIVLEDDCLPDPSFLDFCDELLAHYRDDPRVMHIAGTNWGAAPSRFGGSSYAFTAFAPIWGWATWRRAWKLYEPESAFDAWPAVTSRELVETLPVSRRFRRLLAYDWERVRSGTPEWDRRWEHCVMDHRGVSICPARNLVKNIGFRADATHLVDADRIFSTLPLESIELPLSHPPAVVIDAGVESVFERVHWQKLGWPARTFAKLVPSTRVNRMVRTAWRRLLPRPS